MFSVFMNGVLRCDHELIFYIRVCRNSINQINEMYSKTTTNPSCLLNREKMGSKHIITKYLSLLILGLTNR